MAGAVPETVAQGYVAIFDAVFQTGETYFGIEVPFTATDDDEPARTRYYNSTSQIYREDGQTVGISVFATDVTAQVEARHRNEALQAELLAAAQRQADQRALLYQMFEQAPAVVALLREPGHRYEYVNPAYQALFPGRQLVGQDVVKVVPEMAAQGFVALLKRAYQTGETQSGYEQPFTVSPAPGQAPQTGYFNFSFQAYRESGQIVGVAILANDVTEQVLARQERETQRQQLEELFMQTPAPIVILDGPELVFQLVNPAYQQIFPGRVLAGKPLLTALPELVDTPIPGLLRQVYQTGEPYADQELPLLMARHEGKPPETIYWTFTCQAHRDTHGTIDGVRVFAQDVTAFVQARQQTEALNAELSATNQQLTRTNADHDTFLDTASHDLKAPITNLEGLLTALNKRLPEAAPPVPHLLQLMQGAVERFQHTIAQLTDLTRLQQAQQQPAESVDLAALIEADASTWPPCWPPPGPG